MTKTGVTVGGSLPIQLYQTPVGGLTFRTYDNNSISGSTGKEIVFVTPDTPDSLIGEHKKVYVVKFPVTGGYLGYSVENTQFNN
jgi:hypothetical protein